MDLLLILACLYMAYSNIKSLAAVPLSQWQGSQYAMVVLTVLLVVVGAFKGWQFYQKKKAGSEEENKPEAAQDATALQAEAPNSVAVSTDLQRAEAEELHPDAEEWEIEAADFHYTLADQDK